MRRILVLLSAVVLAFVTGCARQTSHEHVALNWLTSFDQARNQAKAENKLVLMDFTGSDWCGWCIKLHDEVFSTQVFKDYADTNLVLLEVDFPIKKELPPEQTKANEALQTQYKIEGYPTIIVLNAAGQTVGTLGYQAGGPKPFIAELEKLKGKALATTVGGKIGVN